MDELTNRIRHWSRRARLQSSVGLAFFGLACGLGIALVIALAARVFPLMDAPALTALSVALAIIGLVAAFAYPWLRHLRTTPTEWARIFDQRFSLYERTSTALEINEGNITVANDVIRRIQRQDTDRAIEAVNVRERLPLAISRRDALVALIFLVALLIALTLPNPQQQILAERARLRETIAQQIEQLDLARQAIEQSSLSAEQKQLALQALDEAKRALSDPNITPEEAMAAINEAQAQLDALNDLAAQQRMEDLRRAGESLPPDQLTNALANALANDDFDRAAEQMRNLTSSNSTGQPLGEEDLQRLADQIDQLARNVQNSDPEMARQLRQAAQDMRAGDAQSAQQRLDQAAQALEQAGQSRMTAQELSNAQARAEAARQAIQQAARPQSSGSRAQTGLGQSGAQDGQSGANQPGQPGQPGQTSMAGPNAGANPGNPTSGPGFGQEPLGESRKSDDFGTDNSVYAPRRIGNDGKPVVLPDPNSQTAPDPSGRASTAPGGNATVPYEEVYGDYSKAADDALQSGQVPAELRDYVRDYFSSLDPNRQDK